MHWHILCAFCIILCTSLHLSLIMTVNILHNEGNEEKKLQQRIKSPRENSTQYCSFSFMSSPILLELSQNLRDIRGGMHNELKVSFYIAARIREIWPFNNIARRLKSVLRSRVKVRLRCTYHPRAHHSFRRRSHGRTYRMLQELAIWILGGKRKY